MCTETRDRMTPLRVIIEQVRKLYLPGETPEECRDRLRETNRDEIERACEPTLAYEKETEEESEGD